MNHANQYLTIAVLAAVMSLTQVAQAETGDGIDFAHQVLPLLKKHCVECHGGKQAKGGFSINTRESFLAAGHVVAGDAGASYFLERVASDDPETRMPPNDKPAVEAQDIEVLRRWVNQGLPWDEGLTLAESTYQPPLRPRRPELPPAVAGRTNPIDRLIDNYLAEQGIAPLGRVSDAVFLRRVYLDLVGLLPTPDELADFEADETPDKRTRVVHKLLADDQRYAEHWLSFWNDLLRNDYDGTGFITGGRRQITAWLYDALLTNMPFDQFARELVAPATDASRGFIDGIRWRGTVSAAQSVEIQFAQSVSQSLLGINLKCASCHDSFIDDWKLDDAYGMAAIYASEPLDIHRCDKATGRVAQAAWLFPELGTIDADAPQPERLEQLAALLTHPENGRFTRTVVNRLWHRLMGRGIVHPVEAMQSEPWNADLLDYLATDFEEHGYDLKHVLARIATSHAYQGPAESVSEAEKDQPYVFRGPRTRRLTAEQFTDAVWQISGTAPDLYDAKIIRGVPLAASTEVQLAGKWIWSPSVDGDSPPAGEAVVFRYRFKLPELPQSMWAVITCDNEYTLYLNGHHVGDDADWQQLESFDLTGFLRRGDNLLAVVAKNTGDSPNAAGLYFEARAVFPDDHAQHVASDAAWRCRTLDVKRYAPADIVELSDLDWLEARIIEPPDEWSKLVDNSARRKLLEPLAGTNRMVRASLVRSDALMRRLGRPTRDQIVAVRPNEFATLETIELSNNRSLAASLAAAGRRIARMPWDSVDDLIRHLYQATLTRNPTPEELSVLRQAAGQFDPAGDDEQVIRPEVVEDMLWAICMTPDFMLVR